MTMGNHKNREDARAAGFSLTLLTRIAFHGIKLILYITGVVVLLMALSGIRHKAGDRRPFRY